MPNTILGGLMSCRAPPPLPEDLNSFVESAEHGVIFVSFGSVLQASKMPEQKRVMMLNVFSRLKQKVIWKWEAEMPDAPDNVCTDDRICCSQNCDGNRCEICNVCAPSK